MREANNVLLDRALYLWFSQRRSKGYPIWGPLLFEKALELNEKLGVLADFKASTGNFLQSVEEEGYSRDDVYNEDETEVNWKVLPRKSLALKRESTAPGSGECEEENVETWRACNAEDCEFQMLNDDEIVTSAQEESDPVDDEEDEDEDNYNSESSKGPSNADVFSALETAME
ncbi:HTH CENPB-type domain-containing protein [Trichonephila clavipes]|nr:HTH CENPB-type domain-containing protein [Trichonephila clavipes]